MGCYLVLEQDMSVEKVWFESSINRIDNSYNIIKVAILNSP